jgi:glycosyltransferase involved in cell wall biosynthesis
MTRLYGEQGRKDGDECFKNDAKNIEYMAERYPLTQLAIENALGVIVHNQQSFEILARNLESPLAYVPLPFPVTPLPKAQGKSGPPYRLILFGYLGRNRRLSSVFKALAGMPERDQFHLDIFGNILDDEKEVRAELSRLRLKNHVTLHGFSSETELDRYLSQSDLAINLRFPTVGEASGSQLRIWAHALPSLVSQVGWYGTLSPDTVVFVRPDGNEIEDIQRHLKAFLENPARFETIGQQGRKELEQNHSPEKYAGAVIEMAKMAMTARSNAAFLELAERAAYNTGNWASAGSSEKLFSKTAAEIFAMTSR